jgi:hypothetical protein
MPETSEPACSNSARAVTKPLLDKEVGEFVM